MKSHFLAAMERLRRLRAAIAPHDSVARFAGLGIDVFLGDASFVIVGVAWGVGSFVVVGEAGGYTWPWAMYGIPLIFATGVVVSLVTSPNHARGDAVTAFGSH